MIIDFPLQQWLHEAPHFYVTCTLPVLLRLLTRKYFISIQLFFFPTMFLYDSEE